MVSVKTIPDFRPKWSKSVPIFDQHGSKTIPFGAAQTYIAYTEESPVLPPQMKSLEKFRGKNYLYFIDEFYSFESIYLSHVFLYSFRASFIKVIIYRFTQA